MKKATWGWYPPKYQQYENNKYMIIFKTEEVEEIMIHIDHETEEEIKEIVTNWIVWYEEIELPELTQAIKDNNILLIDKILLTERIKLYDSSSFVNEFIINNIPVWLDKNTRTGLKLRFESEEGDSTILWYNGLQFELPIDIAVNMLKAVEQYASKCYDTTQQHLANVMKLQTIEDINNYDYTSNYPDKLIFKL